jgi:hypothetical protein
VKYGHKNATKVYLSQKRTCGRIDRGAGVYGGCYAYTDPDLRFHRHGWCSLGKKCNDRIPLEPCYKPTTEAQLVYVYRLKGKIQPC